MTKSRWLSISTILPIALFMTPSSALDNDAISIHGYTSFEYEKQIDDEGDGDPNGSFDADLVDLVIGVRVNDRVRVAMDITWEHGAASEDNRGNVALEYGFAEYTLTDIFKVRVGKMFTPFGILNEIHTAKPSFLTVKEAASTNKPKRIVDGAYRYFPRWGTGIAFQGDGVIAKKSIDYDLFFSNGEQENTNPYEEDDNKSKAVTARFRIELSETIKLGTSFYHDKITEEGFDDLSSHGLQFEYQGKRWRVLAEAVQGRKNIDTGGMINQLGWFIQPSYHFENGVTPYLQYNHVNPNKDSSNVSGSNIILGVNFEPMPWFMIKIENNYFKGDTQSSLASFPGSDYNEIKASVVLGF